MKISITKAELREIIRLLMIAIIQENKIINDKKMSNEKENERIIDNLNLLLKLKKEAAHNLIENFDDIEEDDEEKLIEELIKRRKRTYTSTYWNFIEI